MFFFSEIQSSLKVPRKPVISMDQGLQIILRMNQNYNVPNTTPGKHTIGDKKIAIFYVKF